MPGEVGVEIADVQAKIGGLVLQVLGLERRLADLTAENARLAAALTESEARRSSPGPRAADSIYSVPPKTWAECPPTAAEVAEELGTR